MTKKIAYVGNFSFPHGNASGSRVLGNGSLLKKIGYEVIFIGLDNTLSASSKLEETKKEYDGFQYYNLPYPNGIKGWFSYKKRFTEVISLLEKEAYFAVISYGSPTLSLFGNLLRKWCKKNNILYLTDVVDWLAGGTGSFMHRTIKFLDNSYQKIILNSKADGVITISSYLSNYYAKKGRNTVVIPPLVNPKRFENLELTRAKSNVTELIYIGMPFATDGRSVRENAYKDRLDLVIESLHRLSSLQFVFNIYGVSKEQYLSVVEKHKNIIEALGSKIKFHGVIANSEGIKKISKSDFTMLFRDVNRMTTAGFPTKFVESISCGTPLITTSTSDLNNYLVDGKNGFFVNIDDVSALEAKMRTILSMSQLEILEMKKHCLESELFSFHHFEDKMKMFINSL